MARPRKPFAELSEGQRKRKLSFFWRHGNLSPSEVERGYNTGTLDQKGSRGHGKGTPEKGVKQALKRPDEFKDYLARRAEKQTQSEPDVMAELQAQALDNFRREFALTLHDTNSTQQMVTHNLKVASKEELQEMIRATDESWKARARADSYARRSSPWFYHSTIDL
jgi:LmbE family N-acetylglucosaminyl deacetylase